jgi:hypothetical protein
MNFGIQTKKHNHSHQHLREENQHLSHFTVLSPGGLQVLTSEKGKPSNHARQDTRGKHGMTDEQVPIIHDSKDSLTYNKPQQAGSIGNNELASARMLFLSRSDGNKEPTNSTHLPL